MLPNFVTTQIDHISLSPLFPQSCANDSSSWAPLPANSTEVTMDAHFDEDNNLESQVMFGHLENTLAVRCLARNEMAAVSREVKLVSNGKNTLVSSVSVSCIQKYCSFPLWSVFKLTFDVVVSTSFPLKLFPFVTLRVWQALLVTVYSGGGECCQRCQCCSSCQIMSLWWDSW